MRYDWNNVLRESYSWRKEASRKRQSYCRYLRVRPCPILSAILLLLLIYAVGGNHRWHDHSDLSFSELKRLIEPLNIVNLSSFQNGARIIPELTHWTSPSSKRVKWSVFTDNKRFWPPAIVLRENNSFTQCWSIGGHNAGLGIQLTGPGYLYAVSIEHNLQALIGDHRSAPRDFRIWGILDSGNYANGQVETYRAAGSMILLTSFTYNAASVLPNQNFTVPSEARRHLVNRIVVEITSNWGGKNTCVYGIRVYGRT